MKKMVSKRAFSMLLVFVLFLITPCLNIQFVKADVPANENENVTVLSTDILGDADGDGMLTQLDAFYIARYCAGWKGYEKEKINYAMCDVDADGNVTQLDAFIIARHLAGWKGYETLPYGQNGSEEAPEEPFVGPSYEEYLAMSDSQKTEYFNSFDSSADFFKWYSRAKKIYEDSKNDQVIGETGDIEL